MAMTADEVLKMAKDKEVKFVDFRFTDTRGKEQHVQVPMKYFTKDKFESGHAFDGSSIAGWKGIQASDMLLMPDASSARMDPFTDEPVLNISCDVYEPMDGKPYDRDPRSIAKKAMRSTARRSPAGKAFRPPTCCSCRTPAPRVSIHSPTSRFSTSPATSSSLWTASRTTAIRARSPGARRRTSSRRASAMSRTLGPSPSSSSSTA